MLKSSLLSAHALRPSSVLPIHCPTAWMSRCMASPFVFAIVVISTTRRASTSALSRRMKQTRIFFISAICLAFVCMAENRSMDFLHLAAERAEVWRVLGNAIAPK